MRVLLGTESTLHLEMKKAIASHLSDDGFEVTIEPSFPPRQFLRWSSYRPDLVGVRQDHGTVQCFFVECETNPSCERILRKQIDSITWQSLLLEELQISYLLVVPSGKLHRVMSSDLRRVWIVWTYERRSGEIRKFPSLSDGVTEISREPHASPYVNGGCSFEGEPE